ncbi:acyl carrier protein [bacterium]|nr:MAG: acyl carrier protein [bacterium]
MVDLSVKQIEKKLIHRLAIILSCDVSSIKPEAPLHTLGADSLSFVELLVFIEQEFKIKLMESGLAREDFRTIRSLAQCIGKALA